MKSTHDELMKVAAKELSSLVNKGKRRVPMVTDGEKGFDAIDDNLPNVCRFYCWNHIINNIKMWLRHHGASASEIPLSVRK